MSASSRLTLKLNPFAVQRWQPSQLAFRFRPGHNVEQLADAFLQARRGQILGPHGSGKSTLLAELNGELTRRGIGVRQVVLHDGRQSFPWSMLRSLKRTHDILLVDGAEQLTWGQRKLLQLLCRLWAIPLLVTTHRELNFPILYRCSPSEEVARTLVAELAPEVDASAAAVSQAYAAARGDLREMFFRLYDLYEQKRRVPSADSLAPEGTLS